AEDGIRDWSVTGVQTCALPIWPTPRGARARSARSSDSSRARATPDSGASRLASLGRTRGAQLQPRLSARTVHRHLERSRAQRLRSEEHTSELQSLTNLVCRLLL